MIDESLIRARRRELGLTQYDVARLAGVSQPMVSYLERGYRPGRSRPAGDRAFEAVAGALGVRADELREDTRYEPLRHALRDFAAGAVDADEFAARMNTALAELGHAARVGVTNERPPKGAVCACRRVEEGGDDS